MSNFMVSCLGNLVDDVKEHVRAQSGLVTYRSRLAVNWNVGEEERTIFIDVSAIPQHLLPYLHKGRRIRVTGSYWPNAYTDHRGNVMPGGHIFANDIVLL